MQAIVKPKEEELMDLSRIIDPQYSAEEVKKHLEVMEDFIDDEKLKKFRDEETSDTWTGDIKDTSLFAFWKKLRRMSNTTNLDCDIFASTMEPTASGGHFMSIDNVNFPGTNMVCESVGQANYEANMRTWMTAKVEELN